MDLLHSANNPIDMKQLMFNNLQFLGLDAPAMEASNHIPFNKAMFELPNKRGAEIVLHFLFQRLNPTMCKEAFRDCWPIHDKKREQSFRKTCSNWMVNIAKDDPDSHLPRINASLFMSPGGDKFYQLLFHFSGYVLQKVMDRDLGSSCGDMLRYPSLTSQNLQLGEVMKKNLVCSSIRHRNGFFHTTKLTLKANRTWKETADEFVKEHRKLSKEIRELDYKIREEEQAEIKTGLTRGSPVKSRGQNEEFDPNFDPRVIKRAQRIQQVRSMWKQLDDFEHSEAAEREVIESIVERTINKHRIDAEDVSIKVPDMLLRECADEIRRRNVDNTYHGGKLNLVSVVQLWNLCLHLYLEKLQQVGVPKFENEVKKLGLQVHTQQSYLKNAHILREQMEERIPALKSSIESLSERLDQIFFKDATPTSIRSTSLGYGFVEPSPQPSFSPEHGVTPAGGIGIPRDTQQVETPEAVAQISEEIQCTVRRGPEQLFNDVDIQLHRVPADRNNSALPKPTTGKKSRSAKSSQAGSQHSSRPTSARSLASSKGSKRSERSTPKASPRVEREVYPTVTSPRTMMDSFRSDLSPRGGVQIGDSPRSQRSAGSHLDSPGSHESARSQQSQKSGSTLSPPHSARSRDSERQADGQTSTIGRLTPTDYLVEEIMGESAVLATCPSGFEAFKSRDQVRRTPDMTDDNKENMRPPDTVARDFNTNALVYSQNGTGEENVEKHEKEDLTDTDIYRLDMELEMRQRDSQDVLNGENGLFEDILGPELDDEYDNDDTGLSGGSGMSQGRLLVIDKSVNIQPEGRETVQSQLPESPRTRREESDLSPPRAIVIDKSFHQSPTQQEKRESPNRSGSSRFSGSPKVSPRSPRYQAVSPAVGSPRQAQSHAKSQSYTESPTSKRSVVRSQLPDSIRSPLSDEIRKMFQEAIADTTPQKSQSPRGLNTSQTDAIERGVLQRSLSGSSRSSFVEQVQLENLVVGENIVRRDSDYLSRSGCLSQQVIELQQKIEQEKDMDLTRPPKVNDILQRVKAMEERMLGRGTPLGSSSDLELPVMDPNSRITDSDDDDGAPKVKGDVSWEMTENLDDIEMPDLDLNDDDVIDDDTRKDLDNEKQIEAEIDLDFKPINYEEFFESKTPELPKRGYGIQSDSLQSDKSSLQMLKFPQGPPDDESPLISFTP